jgi:hypothetical protein
VVLATLVISFVVAIGPAAFVLWRVHRKRRRVQAGLPPDQAQLEWTWHSVLSTLRVTSGAKVVMSPLVTPNEVSSIVGSRLSPPQRDVLRRLSHAVTESRFSFAGVDGGAAVSAAASFDRELRRGLDRPDRLRRWLVLLR